MTVALAYNLSLLVAITVVSGFVDDRWPRSTWAGRLAQGVLFGTAAVVGMLNPLVLTPGIFFDGRSMMLSLGALFFGPTAAAVSAPLAAACRVWQGGGGLWMGLSVIVTATAIGLLLRWRLRGETASLRVLHLFLFGFVVHAVMLALMAFLPRGVVANALLQIGPIVIVVYPLATVLAGRVLADQESRSTLLAGLRQSQELWASLGRNIPGVVYRCDAVPPYQVRAVTEGIQNLVGRPAEEFLSGRLSWVDVVVPEDREALTKAAETGAANVDAFEHEFRIQHADGRIRWVHEKGQGFRGPDGKSSWLDGVVIDITDRKQAEEAARASESRWQYALEEAGHGVWDWNLVTNRVFYSRGWKAVLGLEDAEVGSDYGEWDRRIHPDDRERCHAALQRHVRGNSASYETEHRLLANDGSYRWVLDRGKVVEWRPDGTPLRMIGTHTDITDRRRAAADRLDMERRLLHTQKLESLGILAGGIAHDFNNLLTVILGNLELSLAEAQSRQAREALEQAREASQRAADLTRQMLAYSGRGQFTLARLDLSQAVRANIALLRTSVGKNVRLEFQLADGLPPVEADPGQVQQAIMNLVTNGDEAIGSQPGTVTITTSERMCDAACLSASRLAEKPAPGRFVCLEVRDTGGGMSPETMQRMFEPFFTTKFVGRGLGLSALLGIMRGHGGAILVESAVGQGTVMRALFPVAQQGEAASPPGATSPAASVLAPDRAGAVLVVDDEPQVRRMAAAMITRLGLESIVAEDGHAALKVLAERGDAVRCVLLDLTMPGMDGATTFTEISRTLPGLPVILCSGYSESEATARFTGAGLAGFLQKPYGLDDLRARLATIAARRAAE